MLAGMKNVGAVLIEQRRDAGYYLRISPKFLLSKK